ncbi:MAG: sensor histidine kinase [Myxococcota bacterium]
MRPERRMPNEIRHPWLRGALVVASLVVAAFVLHDALGLAGQTRLGSMSTGVVARDPLLRDLEGLHTYDLVQQIRCCGRDWMPAPLDRALPSGEPVEIRVTREGTRMEQRVQPTMWTRLRLAQAFGPPFLAGLVLLACTFVLLGGRGDPYAVLPVALLTATLGLEQLTTLDINWIHRFERLHMAASTLLPFVLTHVVLAFPRRAGFLQEVRDAVSPIYVFAGVVIVLEQILFGTYPDRWILFSRIRELWTLLAGVILIARNVNALAATHDPPERYRARIVTYGIGLAFGLPVLAYAIDLVSPANLVGAVMPFAAAAVPVSLGLAVAGSDLLYLEDQYRRLLVPGSVTAVSIVALFLIQFGLFRAAGAEAPLERPGFAIAFVAVLALSLDGLRRLIGVGLEQVSPGGEALVRRFLDAVASEDPIASGPAETARFVCDFACRALGSSFAAFVAIPAATRRLHVACSAGALPDELRELDLAMESDAARRLLAASTYMGSPDLDEAERERWRSAGLGHVELAIPVRSAGELEGALLLGTRRRGYSRAALGVLELLAQSAAMALRQARRVAELESSLRSRSSDLARALEQVRAQGRESPLLAGDETRFAWVGKLASGIAHEANKPLYVIEHHLERLARESPGASRSRVESIEIELGRVRALMGDLQAYGRSHEGDLRPVQIESLVRQAAQPPVPGLRIAIEGETGLRVKVDRALVARCVRSLIVNAGAAGAHQLLIRIAGGEGQCVVSFQDDGPGVPEALAEKIFEPFFSTHRVETATGLGLAIAREVARAHGGTLGLAPSARGACFELRLPV